MKKPISILLSTLLVLNIVASGCFAEDSDAWKNNIGTINLSDMTVTGTGASVNDTVIRITAGGDFTVTGTLADGMIYVKTDEKVKLRLSGASITNSSGPAIFFDNVDKGLITITEDTENYLADGSTYTTEDADAALFSNDDLEIKGSGTLTVTGNYQHGIASDDDISIENGIINVTSYEHGIKANNTISVLDGTITVTAQTGKGIKAGEALTIDGGTLNITSTENEGLESKGTLTINGGDINITAGDDGLNTGNESTTTDAAATESANGKNAQTAASPEMPENGTMERSQRSGNRGMQGDAPQEMPQNGFMPEGMPPEMPQGGMMQNGTPPENGTRPDGTPPEMSENGTRPEGTPPEMPENRTMEQNDKRQGGFGGGFENIDAETAAAHAITINGGNIYINANGDAIDSNGSLTFNGGTVLIDGPVSNGDGALDSAGTMAINGGTVLISSSAGMMQLPRNTENQNILSVYYSETQPAGTAVSIQETQSGTELISHTTAKDSQMLVFSSAELTAGTEYTIYVNGEAYETCTLAEGTTSVGTGGGFGGGRGPGGHGGFDKRTQQTNDNIQVSVNGNSVRFDTNPVIKNDTTLVGFRAILEALGASVSWDADTKTVTAQKDGTVIQLVIGSLTADVNGTSYDLLAAPEIIGDSTMVPVRFMSEQLGMQVNWDETTRQITVNAQ